LRGNHGISPKSEEKETCFGCDKEHFIEIKTTPEVQHSWVDQGPRLVLELRRPTKYTPWVPKMNVLQNNFLQICCVTSGYETAYKRKISLAYLTLKDFALVIASNTQLHTLKTTNYKHSTKGDIFKSNYE
jgi:hypothetical protein